jgi:NAD-dependent protein deacetylase/lipoamidase
MDALIQQTAEALLQARSAVALTGAGISIESGIPPFRGPGGLWEKMDPMAVAHIDAFRRNPKKVWNLLLQGMQALLTAAQPNDGHLGLARLEQWGCLRSVITQNVDGLHQAAGSRDVIEFHGTFAWQRCMDCGRRCETGRVDLSKIPPRCPCGGIYRPDCVFFGEMIPPQHLTRSQQLADGCDVLLVVGTSATVQPAAMIPLLAKENGAQVIEINPEPTPLTGRVSNYLIQGGAGAVLNDILSCVAKLRAPS